MNNLLKSETFIAQIIGSSVLWMLLHAYGNFSNPQALLFSFIYISEIIFGFILYKYSVKYMKKFGIIFYIFLILGTLTLSLLILFIICILFGIISQKEFAEIIPLITVFGMMFLFLIILWSKKNQIDEKQYEEETTKTNIEQENIDGNINNKQDKISVKQGTEIHILKTDEIYYFESYGDYVLIYTEKSKFIKEQTMYHFEIVLPQNFIRIHRSYIINSDYMIRLELFGKESYNIRLKNGISLKASKAGYKLLKERLNL